MKKIKRIKYERVDRDDVAIPRVDLTGIQKPKIFDNPKAYKRIRINFEKEMDENLV